MIGRSKFFRNSARKRVCRTASSSVGSVKESRVFVARASIKFDVFSSSSARAGVPTAARKTNKRGNRLRRRIWLESMACDAVSAPPSGGCLYHPDIGGKDYALLYRNQPTFPYHFLTGPQIGAGLSMCCRQIFCEQGVFWMRLLLSRALWKGGAISSA